MSAIVSTARRLKTEDTGKIFEMAICLAYGIPYDGKFSYDIATAEALKPRLEALPSLFPLCKHTAKRGARYDFTAVEDPTRHLSAKTTKGGATAGKVAPQVVGQSQPQKFCASLGIPFVDVPTLKRHIQDSVRTVLPVLMDHTFDCDNIYYNAATGEIRFIRLETSIDWSVLEYEWTRPADTWANSSTLKLKDGPAILEVQFHTKSRTNMAVRWCYDTILRHFKDHFSIQAL